jgi:DNA-binding NarL/FixJ family response regulator
MRSTDVAETYNASLALSTEDGSERSLIMNSQIRVFSVDDHPWFREGIAMMINAQPGMMMVAQASNGREAIESFRQHKPDITLMDLSLPDMSGIDAMIAIRAEFPEARIIILTTFDSDTESRRALAEGARAYMLKSAPPKDLAEAIRQIHGG